MIMRPFTEAEERALVALLEPPIGAYLDITRRRPSTFRRIANYGLVTLMLHKRQTRARLTQTGRYYAELVAATQAERPFEHTAKRAIDDMVSRLIGHADPA